jgi:hypothetical protein
MLFAFYSHLSHVRWVPVPTVWRVLRVRMEERPPVMEVSCEYTEEAAANKRQGVVFQLGGLGVGLENPSL